MVSNTLRQGAFFVLLGLCGCSGGGAAPEDGAAGANVLVITLDTTRADSLGCYGGPDWTSPALDELAAKGVRFADARTVTPVTLPSHATFLTGMLPFEHGVRDNSTFRLPESATTLAERLKDEGYSTGAVMASFVLHSSFGLDQGFDVYSDVPRRSLEVTGNDDQRTASEGVDEALRLIRDELEPPFFLWLHVFDPHWPYDAPADVLDAAVSSTPGSETDLGYLRAQYFAEVLFMDRELGRLFRSLPGGVRNDLLTVVVADHGEGLGDHGERTHALQLFDTTMRIPFLVHHPGLPSGVTIEEPVSIADVTPTVLGLTGFPSEGFSGLDLAPVIRGEASAAADRAVYGETCTPYYTYGWAALYSLVQDRVKFVEGPKPEAFDLAKDAPEHWNVIGQHADFAAQARATFESFASRTATSERVELSAEDQQRFAALGYVGPSGAGEDEPVFWPGRVVEGLRDPKDGLPIQMDTARAMGALRENRMDDAISLIQSVIDRDPKNPLYLTHAGTIYSSAERFEEAAVVLRRSLELREDPSSRCALAIALLRMQRQADAVEQLRQNVAIHPDHLHTRLTLAELLAQTQQWDECREHLDYFLSKHEGDDRYHQHGITLRNIVRQRTGE